MERPRWSSSGGASNETISDGWAGWKYSRPVRPPTPERCVVKRRWSYMGSKMANAEWSPRKNFNAGSVMSVKNKRYGPSRGQKISESYEYLYVFGGFDGDSRLDDCYESLNGTAWLKDYSEPGTYNDGTTHDGTSSMLYVRPSSDVRKLGMMTDEQIQLLYDEGITTIEELAGADRSIIMKLRGGSYEPDPLDGPEQYRGGDFLIRLPH